MKSKSLAISAIVILVAIIVLINVIILGNIPSMPDTSNQQQESYTPIINPDDFTTKINNKYLTFTPGTKYIYEGKVEEGIERTEVYVTSNIKNVMGVNVLEVRDKVFLNNELIEDTKDWYAQDKFGNVWYFGEDSKEIVDGKIASTEGSWVAGYYGAQPGIVMEANPKIGDRYRQEYFKGQAEDMAEVVSLGVQIKVKYGTFNDCLQTKDWNPLEPGDDEYKYYCPSVGNMVYEVSVEDGENQQLVDVQKDVKSGTVKEEPLEELKTQVTEQEAISIAKREVSGRVTDVGIERKFGKNTWVVEIDDDGEEIDVIIDIDTGEVLGTED